MSGESNCGSGDVTEVLLSSNLGSRWAKWSRVLCSKIRGSRTRSHDGLECHNLKMCSRAGSDRNLRMSEDGGASSLEESKCLAGIFQQIVNDCKVSFLISSCFVVPADGRKL